MSEKLTIETVVNPPYGENSYVVWNGAKDCIVIDPGGETDAVMDIAFREGLRISEILITHGHIDHILGNAELRRRTGALISVHPESAPMLSSRILCGAVRGGIDFEEHGHDATFEDDEFVGAGNLKFRVILSPGHCPGHCMFYHEGSGTLFAGDLVFRDAVGRWDLPGADRKVLFDSIREKFLVLPDDTEVYPGHGDPTTVGRERSENGFLLALK